MKDLKNYDPKNVEDSTLIDDHRIVHAWWANIKSGKSVNVDGENVTPKLLKELHKKIVDEMLKRGMNHINHGGIDETYAPVHGSGNVGDVKIELVDVMNAFNKPIMINKGFVTLVGGIVNRGYSSNDIDILIRWPKNVPEEVVHPVIFRLGRALGENASKVHWLLDEYHGPFTSHVELYDLVLVPSRREYVEMGRLRSDWAEKEAQKSKEDDEVVPMRMIYPLKGMFGYRVAETYDPEQVISWFDERDYPLFVQKKYDGARHIVMKDGDRVKIVSEDGEDNTDRFPTIVEWMRKNLPNVVTLDCEVEGWDGKKHLGREEISGYIHAKTEPNDKNVVFNVFDILYFDDEKYAKHSMNPRIGDLHNESYAVRYEYLKLIDFPQSTMDIPKPGVNLVPNVVVEKPDELAKAINEVAESPASEGAMVKSSKGKYPLNGVTNDWVKFKKFAEVHAIVLDVIETKTKGVYNLLIGVKIPSGWKVPEKYVHDGKYAIIGKTYNVKGSFEKGDIVTIKFHNVFHHKSDEGEWLTIYEPGFVEKRERQEVPDSLDDLKKIGENAGVLVVKAEEKQNYDVVVGIPGKIVKRQDEGTPEEMWDIEEIRAAKSANLPWLMLSVELGVIFPDQKFKYYNVSPPDSIVGYKIRRKLRDLGVRGLVYLRNKRSRFDRLLSGMSIPVVRVNDVNVAKMLVETKDKWITDKTIEEVTVGNEKMEDYGVVAHVVSERARPSVLWGTPTVALFSRTKIEGLPEFVASELDKNMMLYNDVFHPVCSAIAEFFRRKMKLSKVVLPFGVMNSNVIYFAKDVPIVAGKSGNDEFDKLILGQQFDPSRALDEIAKIECAYGDYERQREYLLEKLPKGLKNVRIVDSWVDEINDDSCVVIVPPKITLKDADADEKVEMCKKVVMQTISKQPRIVMQIFNITMKIAVPTIEDMTELYEKNGYTLYKKIFTTSHDAICIFSNEELEDSEIEEEEDVDEEDDVELSEHWMDDKPHGYIVHHHYRGKSVHADLRIKVGDDLEGWTLNIQKEGSIKEPVRTLREAKQLERERYDEISKLNSANRILVEEKQPEPLEWMKFEGVVEPGEVGATKENWGVFSIVDRGVVFPGAQKKYMRELYFYGSKLKGRWILRKLPSRGSREGFMWLMWKTKDEKPYVLSRNAVRDGWMPPLGVSCIPPELRKKIPKEYRFWEARTIEEARKMRDEYVKTVKLEDINPPLIDKPKSIQFVFQHHWWRGPIVVRKGPSGDHYDLRMKIGNKLMKFVLDSDLTTSYEATGYLEYEDTMKYFNIKDIEKIPPGEDENPTKETDSYIRTIVRGSGKVYESTEIFMKFHLDKIGGIVAHRENPHMNYWVLKHEKLSPNG